MTLLFLLFRCDALSTTRQQVHPPTHDLPAAVEEDALLFLWHRRAVINAAISSAALVVPSASHAVSSPPPLLRDVDVGGGFDLLGRPRLAEKDVVYPASMEGPWVCHRRVTHVEGDAFQAGSAWKAMGGNGPPLRADQVETYPTRFVTSGVLGGLSAVVADRGFEMASRTRRSGIAWNVDMPDTLEYDKFKIAVVRRNVEPPSDQGFGFDELYRIQDGPVTRAVQVKRRYRRAFDEDGNRVVEGLEIMKTFRVLDGVAGTEIPTSTTKSKLRLTRP
jgi:hypothetical protein